MGSQKIALNPMPASNPATGNHAVRTHSHSRARHGRLKSVVPSGPP